MNNVQLQDLARIGAQTRLAALDREREALLKMFPGLRAAQQPTRGKNGSQLPATRRRGGMSPAARKAHGERMRAYWATDGRRRTARQRRPARLLQTPPPLPRTRRAGTKACPLRRGRPRASGCERT